MTIAQIETLIAARTDGGNNPISTERDLWTALKNESCKLYEVKEIDVNLITTPNFFTDNFIMAAGPTLGLGKESYEGFAICNGNNGTRDRGGKTSVGWKPASSYQIPGTTAGAETVALSSVNIPNKILSLPTSESDTAEEGGPYFMLSNDGATSTPKTISLSYGNGGGGADAHNNMQPYIVTVFIQRIA